MVSVHRIIERPFEIRINFPVYCIFGHLIRKFCIDPSQNVNELLKDLHWVSVLCIF